MPSYTVTEIVTTRPWTPAGESEPKTIYYDVKVEGEDRAVNVGRKPGNPLTVGDVLEGTIGPDDRGGLKFTRANGGFKGGGRPRDPKESAVIVQQHSQAQALRYAELQQARGKLPDDFNLEQVLVIAAKFAADAKAATP